MKKKYCFGFLLLDEIHHINHFISIAVALSKDHSVKIITYPSAHTYLKDKLTLLQGDSVIIEELTTHPFRRFTDVLKKRKLPRKGFWMKYNRKYLLTEFDALIFTDFIHHKLHKYRGKSSFPKFILTPHGPAGRAYGYSTDVLDFDMHIVFGEREYNQLEDQQLLGNHTTVAGYFKLDALKGQELPKLFSNQKPIVAYIPHFSTEFTSWHVMGLQVLDYFKNQDRFNLIFAPHINLFNKTGVESDRSILEPYENIPHIHIDLGSVASVDMVYTQMADIYLGDVSSQVIEFIITPRPCLFLNVHKVEYQGNPDYHFWQNGQVIDSIGKLDEALQQAEERFPDYSSIQQQSTKQDFNTNSQSTATERGVKQILDFMNTTGL